MWTISLVGDTGNRERAFDIYGKDYFPRTFHYKTEARDLWKRLRNLNILSRIDKSKPNK
jgi:hypothetical protein